MEIKSVSTRIKLQPLKITITPFAFIKYSQEYFDAKQTVKKHDGYSPLPYFLICRSIELAFKSYLLHKGLPVKDVKLYKHDLIKLYSEICIFNEIICIKLPGIVDELQKANDYYNNKSFEYFELNEIVKSMKGYPYLPDLDKLEDLSKNLLDEVKLIIK